MFLKHTSSPALWKAPNYMLGGTGKTEEVMSEATEMLPVTWEQDISAGHGQHPLWNPPEESHKRVLAIGQKPSKLLLRGQRSWSMPWMLA